MYLYSGMSIMAGLVTSIIYQQLYIQWNVQNVIFIALQTMRACAIRTTLLKMETRLGLKAAVGT